MNKILLILCIIAAAGTGYVLLGSDSAVAPSTTSKNEVVKTVAENVKKTVEPAAQTQGTVQPTAQSTTANSNNEKKPMELEIKTTKEGTGTRVIKSGDTISVHYTGKLTDGTKFDSSVDRGTPFEFTIGQGMVIAGWEKGFLGAKVGEKRTLTIPSEMGYGARGAGSSIPPNATLIFDVEVVAIK